MQRMVGLKSIKVLSLVLSAFLAISLMLSGTALAQERGGHGDSPRQGLPLGPEDLVLFEEAVVATTAELSAELGLDIDDVVDILESFVTGERQPGATPLDSLTNVADEYEINPRALFQMLGELQNAVLAIGRDFGLDARQTDQVVNRLLQGGGSAMEHSAIPDETLRPRVRRSEAMAEAGDKGRDMAEAMSAVPPWMAMGMDMGNMGRGMNRPPQSVTVTMKYGPGGRLVYRQVEIEWAEPFAVNGSMQGPRGLDKGMKRSGGWDTHGAKGDGEWMKWEAYGRTMQGTRGQDRGMDRSSDWNAHGVKGYGGRMDGSTDAWNMHGSCGLDRGMKRSGGWDAHGAKDDGQWMKGEAHDRAMQGSRGLDRDMNRSDDRMSNELGERRGQRERVDVRLMEGHERSEALEIDPMAYPPIDMEAMVEVGQILIEELARTTGIDERVMEAMVLESVMTVVEQALMEGLVTEEMVTEFMMAVMPR